MIKIILGIFFASAVSFANSKAEHVVIVSIDGLSPHALQMAKAPNIKAWAAQGVSAPRAYTVVPAVTMNSHASMISGVGPTKHLMLVNSIYSAEMKVPSIFDLARQNGLKTAMVASKAKFDKLVDESSLSFFKIAVVDANGIVQEMNRAVREASPNVMLAHFSDVDQVGHLHGWYTPAQLAALEKVDEAFGRLINEIEANKRMAGKTIVILTSDHGGSGHGHGYRPDDFWIPWYAVGPGIPAGSEIKDRFATFDTAAMTARFLGLNVPPKWEWMGQVRQIVK